MSFVAFLEVGKDRPGHGEQAGKVAMGTSHWMAHLPPSPAPCSLFPSVLPFFWGVPETQIGRFVPLGFILTAPGAFHKKHYQAAARAHLWDF